MKKWGSILLGFALVACAGETNNPSASASEEAGIETSPADLQATDSTLKTQVENGLTPPVIFDGEPTPTFSISERMNKHNTPAISIAYAKGGEIVWADTYGENVGINTLFQAASMSKAVAAVGITAYAQAHGIDLDEDVDAIFPGVNLREISPEGSSISLRALLSHTAGATIGGFPGYAIGDTVPSNLDVILGGEGTNTDAVIFKPNPDGEFSYSGGGFQVAQAVIEAHSGQPFEAIMDEYVLTPAGLSLSTFAPKAPGSSSQGIATAHNGDGSPVEGGWHVYPEQAAAGLWTTPSEYSDFVFALMNPSTDESITALTESMSKEVLTPVSEAYGLGIGINDVDGRTRYRHGGSNRGYRCVFMAFPDTDEVFVLMTNGANGSALGSEIIRSAAQAYGWPDSAPKSVTRVAMNEGQLANFAGAYALPGSTDPYATLTVGDQELAGTLETGGEFALVPLSETDFIDPDDGQEISFREEDGQMLLSAGQTVLTRLPSN